MSESHKIFIAICRWNEKESVSNWVPLYSQLIFNGTEIKYDAYGRTFGQSYFQVPRKMQKQDINGDVRYYCFEDYGENVLVYKETGYNESSGGGSGGGTPAPIPDDVARIPTRIIDTTTTSAYIPVLSGGTQYIYRQPLVELNIGSITDTPIEDTIIFSAGSVIIPTMDVWFESTIWDNDMWGWENGSKSITLVSSNGGYVYVIPNDGLKWSDANGDEENWSIILSNGSFTCINDNGMMVLSAHGIDVVSYHSNGWDGEESNTVSSLNGTIASSTDGQDWTFGGITIRSYDYSYDDGLNQTDGSACQINFSSIINPGAVIIPSGVELVGSSKIETKAGSIYEMNIANGGIVMAERFDQEA